MTHTQATSSWPTDSWKIWLALLLLMVLIRLATLGAYPLTDNTEARYAEVAQEMVASGNWITPQLHGEKFWSKPPLVIWAAATSMALLGRNEFSGRLPSFLFSLLTLVCIYALGRRRMDSVKVLAACVTLMSTALFFVGSGALMTDAALTLGTTLAMVSFWLSIQDGNVGRGIIPYLFFGGLAIGLLAKGPVAVVLVFMPLVIWTAWKKQWKTAWRKMPWIRGLLLTAVLTLPWYLAAEYRTPGFLNYFLVGEHWNRYLHPGWTGDLYGSAHSQPRGTIWLFWIAAAFPWSLMAAWLAFAKKRLGGTLSALRHADDWTAYLLAWAVTPMIFFTMAGNILWTYVLPGLPALALLMANHLSSATAAAPAATRRWRPVPAWLPAALVPAVFLVGVAAWHFVPYKNSQKYLVETYHCLRPNPASRLIYLFDRPYSAEFYSGSKAVELLDIPEMAPFFKDAVPDFFAVNKAHLIHIPTPFMDRLIPMGTFDNFVLLGEKKGHETHAPIAAQCLPASESRRGIFVSSSEASELSHSMPAPALKNPEQHTRPVTSRRAL